MNILKRIFSWIKAAHEYLDEKFDLDYKVSFWLPIILVGIITILVLIEGVGAYGWALNKGLY